MFVRPWSEVSVESTEAEYIYLVTLTDDRRQAAKVEMSINTARQSDAQAGQPSRSEATAGGRRGST